MQREPRILLVEDEAPKRHHIETLLKDLTPSARILFARSVNSALDVLETGAIDLLILDMSLPTFDVGERERGGRPQGFGGTEVLRNMAMSEIECPTVVITGYEGFLREGGSTVDLAQLRTELMDEFPKVLRAVLHYNSTFDEWKTVLSVTLVETGLTGDPKCES
ncbi:response regulator [Hephaestia sp. GCM10023244]|uniref:response regulator n=1 Tax=unclassified Hephaestia TaxID=2631281 RepID=UPI002076DC63|nr:response regulator [Hephaestia sp. MAHUQ-44]MCM8732546.1 response regulator [Hephaestia sp. MAHUQ-44]